MPITRTANDILKIFAKDMYVQLETPSPVNVPTGSWIIDSATGGGIPRRAITQISGPESAGKTSLALSAMVQFQATLAEGDTQDKILFVDAEGTFKPQYAEQIGVDMSRVMLIGGTDVGDVSFKTGEQTFDFIRNVCSIDKPEFGMIIVDSIPSLVPQNNFGVNTQESSGMAEHARMLNRVLPGLINPVKVSNTALVLINQLRLNPGAGTYQNPEYVPGGRALAFYTSLHLKVKTRKADKQGDDIVGWPWIITIMKTKMNNSKAKGTTIESFFRFGEGIDIMHEIAFAGPKTNVLNKDGHKYYFHAERIEGVVGTKQLLQYFKDNPEFLQEVKRDIVKAIADNPMILVDKKEVFDDHFEEE